MAQPPPPQPLLLIHGNHPTRRIRRGRERRPSRPKMRRAAVSRAQLRLRGIPMQTRAAQGLRSVRRHRRPDSIHPRNRLQQPLNLKPAAVRSHHPLSHLSDSPPPRLAALPAYSLPPQPPGTPLRPFMDPLANIGPSVMISFYGRNFANASTPAPSLVTCRQLQQSEMYSSNRSSTTTAREARCRASFQAGQPAPSGRA